MDDGPDVPKAEILNEYVVSTWVDDDARFSLILWNPHLTTGPRTNFGAAPPPRKRVYKHTKNRIVSLPPWTVHPQTLGPVL